MYQLEKITLEVIATSVVDVQLAEAYGADRIELISGIAEGGITPSYGLIAYAVQATSLPVHVMIRPHANSFCYSKTDVEIMKEDIRIAKKLGASGVVIGALTEDTELDIPVLEELLAEANGVSVTFHRAFDEIKDQMAALNVLSNHAGIDRVLTSGGKTHVTEAIEDIKKMVKWSQNQSLSILAGSGLTLDNLDHFVQKTGVREVHLGTGVRKESRALAEVDPFKVRAAADILRGK